MKFPNKNVHKSTTTDQLRFDISELSKKTKQRSYIEIGCDRGFTLFSISQNTEFELYVGVDIRKDPIIACEKTTINKEFLSKNYKFITGTSDDIFSDNYDIVFIDGLHTYESVKKDFENIITKNLSDDYYIIFHDYGLKNAGVKKFIQSTFKEFNKCGQVSDWNKKGSSIDDVEAVYVHIKVKKDESENESQGSIQETKNSDIDK